MQSLNIRYQPGSSKRDLRLDFMRGYFVLVMTIDHMRTFPAWTLALTGGGRLWVSAAVGFILVSGLVMGSIYRSRVTQNGWHWAISQVGRRALQLYVLAVISRIILASGDYILRYYFERPSHVPTNYWHLLEGALLQVRYGFPFVDLLPLYAFFLLLGLVGLYFLQQGKWRWVILVSFLIWHAGRIDPGTFSFLRVGFYFAVWQFPFFLGLVIGYHQSEIGRWRSNWSLPRWPISVLLIGSAAAMLILSYQITYHNLWPGVGWLKSNSEFFHKWRMGPGRIMAALWIFAGTYEFITQFWHILDRLFGWLLLLLGQKALTAYLVQGFLSYFVTRLPGFPFPDYDPLLMGFLHLLAVLLVWSITRIAAPWLEKWPVKRISKTAVTPIEPMAHVHPNEPS